MPHANHFRRSRSMVIIALMFSVLAGGPPLQAAEPGKTSKKAIAPSKRAAADEAQLIQGHWVCTHFSQEGEVRPDGDGCHAVFTDKEVKISAKLSGMVFEYALDPKTKPKHCDLRAIFFDEFPIPAIYDLQKDALRLVIPSTLTFDNVGTYPTGFEPADARVTYVFRRAKKDDSKPAARLSKEESAALDSLRKDQAEALRLLEAKKYREFVECFAPPTGSEESFSDDVAERMKEVGPVLAELLRLVASAQPVFDAPTTRATYDLRPVHVNGAPPHTELSWVKSGDHWHIDDSR